MQGRSIGTGWLMSKNAETAVKGGCMMDEEDLEVQTDTDISSLI